MKQNGILLMNLGSPDSPAVPDVRRYLREFLMDPCVIDVAWPLRALIVHGLILPFRPKASAEAYHKIWRPDGSPLVSSGRRTAEALEARLGLPVALAMRYRQPPVEAALRQLTQRGVTDCLLVPLFPHFAMSSYQTAVAHVRAEVARVAPALALRVAPPFYDDMDYIGALVTGAAATLAQPYDHLLFSYHGLPERHMRKSDPTHAHCLSRPDCCAGAHPAHATCYRAQCFKTTDAFVARAGIPAGKWSVSFQSRLGREPWLRPYTDFELPRLAAEGARKLLVICPAFVADCLETLEEIGLRGRDTFLAAGGRELHLIPCLNEHPAWLAALERMTRRLLAAPAASSQPGPGEPERRKTARLPG